MCLYCAQNISDEDYAMGLAQIVPFEEYNTTSINFFLYGCCGFFGEKSRIPSITHMKDFIKWARTKDIFYMPKNGLEVMYHPDLLERLINWCEQYNPQEQKNTCKDAIVKDLFDQFGKIDQELINSDYDYMMVRKHNIINSKYKNNSYYNITDIYAGNLLIASGLLCISLVLYFVI